MGRGSVGTDTPSTFGGAGEGGVTIVSVGGLITPTALNLLVLPTLALRYGKFSAGGASAS